MNSINSFITVDLNTIYSFLRSFFSLLLRAYAMYISQFFFLSPKLKTSNDNNKSYRKCKHHSIPSELFDDDGNIIIQQLTVFLQYRYVQVHCSCFLQREVTQNSSMNNCANYILHELLSFPKHRKYGLINSQRISKGTMILY